MPSISSVACCNLDVEDRIDAHDEGCDELANHIGGLWICLDRCGSFLATFKYL